MYCRKKRNYLFGKVSNLQHLPSTGENSGIIEREKIKREKTLCQIYLFIYVASFKEGSESGGTRGGKEAGRGKRR